MSVTYTNRKGFTFYLCRDVTQTGKPRYFFAREVKGGPVKQIPDGYTITESVNGIVSRSKTQTSQLREEEINVVKAARSFQLCCGSRCVMPNSAPLSPSACAIWAVSTISSASATGRWSRWPRTSLLPRVRMHSLNGYKVRLTTALRLGLMPRVAIVDGKTTALVTLARKVTPLTIHFDQLVAGLNEPSVPAERSTPQQSAFW